MLGFDKKVVQQEYLTLKTHCYYFLTLQSGLPIDVASHEPPSFSVLGSTLGVLVGETRPLGDVVTPLQS